MKLKNLLALLLAVLMLVTLFAACSTNEEEPAPGDDSSTAPDETDGGDVDDGEITTINFWWTDTGTTGSAASADDVAAAINEITEAEIGVHVNMQYIANADYPTQINLMVGNQEPVDVAVYLPGVAGSFLTFYTNGILSDITDLLDEYGKDVKALFGDEVLAMTTVDGRVYGLSTYRLLNSSMYWCARKDALETAGMTELAENMTTWAELETILEAITENAGMYGFGASNAYGLLADPGAIFAGEKLSDTTTYDILGDSLYVVYSDQEGNVSLLQEQEAFVEQCEMVAGWMSNGWMWPDTAYNSKDGSEILIGQGVFASYFTQSEYGIEVNKTQQIGQEMFCLNLKDSVLSTTQGQKFGIFIPVSAAEPEAAMKFINLLYTNKDLMNLYIYGIEGTNWVLNEDGVGEYPEGKDSSTCGWHTMDFMLGNQFLVYPWTPLPATFRDEAKANFDAAPRSAYLGFTLDTSGHDTLMAGITAVVNQFMPQITGGLYTEALYSEFIEQLKGAGIDEWITLYQDALTEWLAA